VVGTTIRLTNQDLSVIPQLPGPQNSLSRMPQNYWHKAQNCKCFLRRGRFSLYPEEKNNLVNDMDYFLGYIDVGNL